MNKEKMIKIGIATGIARIKQHLRTYNKLINLKESYIVTAKDDNTIRMLERQFLNDYKEFAIDNNKFNNLDGATELRKIEILDDVLEDIQYKANKLKLKDIKIKKGINIESNIKNKNTFTKSTNDFIYKELTKELIKDYIQFFIDNTEEIKRMNNDNRISTITFRDEENQYKILEVSTSSNMITRDEIFIIKQLFKYKNINKENSLNYYKYCIKVNDFCDFVNSSSQKIFTCEDIANIFFNICSNRIKTIRFIKSIIIECCTETRNDGSIYLQAKFNKDIVDFILKNNLL